MQLKSILGIMSEIGTSSVQSSPEQEDPPQPHNGIDCGTAAGCANCDCQLFYQSCVRKRLPVEFNELGQPIGANGRILARSIGDISRNGKFAPISYIHWKMVPDQKKEDMLKVIGERFEFNANKGRTWILERLGHCWRDWTAHLKARYIDPYDTYEEKLAAYDKIVIPGLKRPRLRCNSSECLFAKGTEDVTPDQELIQQPSSPEGVSTGQPTNTEAMTEAEAGNQRLDAESFEGMMEQLEGIAADLEATKDKLVTAGSPMNELAKVEEMLNQVEGMKKRMVSRRGDMNTLANINHGDVKGGASSCTQTDATDERQQQG